ncbi:hypothetical protein BH24DEI1_BH24DEI1_03240 [soil metagenome]
MQRTLKRLGLALLLVSLVACGPSQRERDLGAQNEALLSENARLQAELEEARARLAELEEDSRVQRERQPAIDRERAELAELRRQSAEQGGRVAELEQALQSSEAQIEALLGDQENIDILSAELVDRDERLAALDALLTETQVTLAGEREAQAARAGELEAALELARLEARSRTFERSAAQADRDRLAADLSEAQESLEAASAEGEAQAARADGLEDELAAELARA